MIDADGEAMANGSLAAIARTLGVPVAEFFVTDLEGAGGRSGAEQETELLSLFRQIDDADQRQSYLAFLRTAVRKQAAK